MSSHNCIKTVLIASAIFLFSASLSVGETLFEEQFDDANFGARGWYDNTNPRLSTVEHVANSTKSLEYYFAKGTTTPANGAAMRKKFTESESVYIRYYVKYSSNWEGSNVAYHPHEFYLLTNKDGDWSGLSNTRLTAYIEQNEGKPQVVIQDGMNIDTANINKDLTAITEKRAVAGCNGDSDGYGKGDCYGSGSTYNNGKTWKTGTVVFSDVKGAFYKNDWHLVEAFIKMNSIVSGKATKDGIIQYWFDGNPILDYSNVVIRTGQHPDMKFNQFLIAPYIGVGSPVAQTFWIDDLVVATSKPGGTTSTQPSSPQNLRVMTQ